MTAPASTNLTRILWPVAIVTLAALATWRACRPSAKTGTIWSCGETASGCTCGGSLEEVDRPKEKLCKREYECCVDKREASFEHYENSCDCWNPSKGGPSCESRLPKQPVLGWSRVERCQ
jgi:hypothetical protein